MEVLRFLNGRILCLSDLVGASLVFRVILKWENSLYPMSGRPLLY